MLETLSNLLRRWLGQLPSSIPSCQSLLFTAAMAAALLANGASRAGAAAPLDIAVMVSSDGNRCFHPGVVKAIRQFTADEVARINREAASGAPRLRLTFHDDYESAETATGNLREALANPRLLAVIGLSSSSRAQAVFSALGKDLQVANVPVLSEISLSSIFADMPSVFSMASTVDSEVQVVKRFIEGRGFTRPAFIGLARDDYAAALGDGLVAGTDAVKPVMDQRIASVNSHLDEATGRELAAEFRRTSPDLLVLAVQSGLGADVLKALKAAGSEVPVLVLYGRGQRILDVMAPTAWDQDIFEIARDGVPGLLSERLQRQIWQTRGHGWIFPDTPDKSSPGWSNGACGTLPPAKPLHILDEPNKRAIGRGRQYADMVALIGAALADSEPHDDIAALRERIVRKVTALSSGQAIARGSWQDWSFTRSRSSADDTLVTMRPRGKSGFTLAPLQYHRVGDTLQPIPVLTLSLDPVSLARIDTNLRTFEAEFYLSLASEDKGLSIDAIEFTNAARSPASGERLVRWREVHDGGAGTSFPAGVRLYKIAGKFTFEPELGRYPFDSQRLLVSFQPASTAKPFLIQPSRRPASGEVPDVDDFLLLDQYVGSDQDVIPTLEPATGGTRVVSFYKFNQGWVVKRATADFYLRVVVPLVFILLVTWFSAFLSEERFDSAMAIQVTALLSAIALYLALPSVDSPEPTLYDKIFMLTYAAVSAMIGLTVLRDRLLLSRMPTAKGTVAALQTVAFPLAIAAAALMILMWSA